MVNRSHKAAETTDSRRLSRRQMLALTSGAATVGLAGCSGQSPDTEEVLTTTEGDQSSNSDTDSADESSQGGTPLTTELTIRKPVSWTPGDSNVNPFASQGDFEYWVEYMWWESLTYPDSAGEAIHWLADDISLEGDGCDVVISLKEDYTWWDGTPVTAQDVYTSQMISIYQEYGGPEATDSEWVVEDDYTIRHELSGPANPDIQKSEYLSIVAKHDYFESWLEQFEDASNDDAVSSVAQELDSHKISIDDMVEEGLGCGMWQPVQYDPTEVVHEKYEDHPRADWTNLDTFNWVLMADNQKSIQALQSGEFDFGDKMLTQVEQMDDLEVFNQYASGVVKVSINFENKHLARRPVRRAMAYLIDHEELVDILKGSHGQEYFPHRNSINLSEGLADQWLSDEFTNSIIDYGVNSQPDKAAEVLEDAGYTKDGSLWVDEDGDAVEGLDYLTPPWPIYESIGKYLSPKLKEFGFDNKLIVPSSSSFWNTWSETFDFDMCNWFTTTTHPATAFSTVGAQGLGRYDVHAEPTDPPEGCEINRQEPEIEQEYSEKLNHPIRPEFPTEVGAMEVSGDSQTLYPFKWTNVMNQSQDEAEVRDLTEKLVWYHNWQVPAIGLYDETRSFWGRTDTYNFPRPDEVDDHPNAEETMVEHTASAMEFLAKGHISAKTE